MFKQVDKFLIRGQCIDRPTSLKRQFGIIPVVLYLKILDDYAAVSASTIYNYVILGE